MVALVTSTLHAAPLTDRADAEGERLKAQADEIAATRPRGAAELLSQAAERWASILDARPESQEHQQLRESAYCKASQALLQAHALDPGPALVDRGVELSRGYLAARERVYGASLPEPAYCDPAAQAAEFARLRPEPGRAALPVEAPAPAPREPGPPQPRRWPVVGMWSALGLTVGFGAAALGTAIALRHDPHDPADRSRWGTAFEAIQNAVARHPEVVEDGKNYCVGDARRNIAELARACRTYDAMVATSVLFAAAAVTTATFLGLVLRDRGRVRRGERPSIAAGPTRGGAVVELRLRF